MRLSGSAAVIVSGAARNVYGPEVVASTSAFYRGTEDVMGWDISSDGFNIVLSSEVPSMVRKHLAHDIDAFLGKYRLCRDDISTWIMHTGGPKVLEATAEVLDLRDDALQVSWDCLARVGNLSSASVLLVLEEYMNRRRPAPGTYSILAAMGPGFCSELVLLRW
jgi:alkylresorcinol/alkylpyrone synthase